MRASIVDFPPFVFNRETRNNFRHVARGNNVGIQKRGGRRRRGGGEEKEEKGESTEVL